MNEFLIGSCEVQLNRLQFVVGREPKEASITKLAELFELSCDPEEHHIPVLVCPDELQAALDALAVFIENLVQGHLPLPRLTPSSKLRSIHG